MLYLTVITCGVFIIGLIGGIGIIFMAFIALIEIILNISAFISNSFAKYLNEKKYDYTPITFFKDVAGICE